MGAEWDVLVPISPQKHSSSRQDKRSAKERGSTPNLASLLPGRSTMTAHVRAGVTDLMAECSREAKLGSAFLSGSASANRNAMKAQAHSSKEKVKASSYSRNANAAFHSIASSSRENEKRIVTEAYDTVEQQISEERKRAAEEVVEGIPIGPRIVHPSEDDPHFLTIEPTSNVKLKKRFTSHSDLCNHLDGRRYVSISTLYQIKLDGKSDDGDFTIPIDGDWILMGVVTEKHVRETKKAVLLDTNHKPIDDSYFEGKWNAYLDSKGDEGPNSDDEDNPYRAVLKRVPAKRCITLSLVDMGHDLVNQETPGDATIKVHVYEADESHLAEDGRRVYKGGSGGAFETFDKIGMGTLLGLLNPLVKKEWTQKQKGAFGSEQKQFRGLAEDEADGWKRRSKWSDNELNGEPNTDDKRAKVSKMLCLEPRRGDNVLPIGKALYYGKCGALCKNGSACENFVDLRARMKACEYHMHQVLNYSRNARQEFANGSSSFKSRQKPSAYAMSDGMSIGAQPRLYVSTKKRSIGPFSESDQVAKRKARDVEQREKEREHFKQEQRIRDGLQQSQSSSRSHVHSPRGGAGPVHDNYRERRSVAERQSTGARAIDDALKELRKQQPGAILGHNVVGKKKEIIFPTSKAPQDRRRSDRQTFDPRTGQMRHATTSASDTNPISDTTSKLLARHSAQAAALPKPMMRWKKKQGESNRSAVRPPPGESFYDCNESDEELDFLVHQGALDGHLDARQSDESDFEIID